MCKASPFIQSRLGRNHSRHLKLQTLLGCCHCLDLQGLDRQQWRCKCMAGRQCQNILCGSPVVHCYTGADYVMIWKHHHSALLVCINMTYTIWRSSEGRRSECIQCHWVPKDWSGYLRHIGPMYCQSLSNIDNQLRFSPASHFTPKWSCLLTLR